MRLQKGNGNNDNKYVAKNSQSKNKLVVAENNDHLIRQIKTLEARCQYERAHCEDVTRTLLARQEEIELLENRVKSYEDILRIMHAEREVMSEELRKAKTVDRASQLQLNIPFALDDLEISCAVCFEEWSDNVEPKIATCGHAICRNCIANVGNECPTCRRENVVYTDKCVGLLDLALRVKALIEANSQNNSDA